MDCCSHLSVELASNACIFELVGSRYLSWASRITPPSLSAPQTTLAAGAKSLAACILAEPAALHRRGASEYSSPARSATRGYERETPRAQTPLIATLPLIVNTSYASWATGHFDQ